MKHINFELSSVDPIALLAALQTVPFACDEVSPDDTERVCEIAEGIAEKLMHGLCRFTASETQVLIFSIRSSYKLLSGKAKYSVPQDVLAELRPHVFAYNRILRQLEQLDPSQGLSHK